MQPTTKKRAGRPPKNKKTDHLVEIRGIVDQPDDSNNIVEVFITRPTILKKLLSSYNDYNADNIRFEFTKTQMIMSYYAENKKLVAYIDGNKCNSYYCESPISLYVNCEILHRINNYIEPEYDYDFRISVIPSLKGRSMYVKIFNKNSGENERYSMCEVNVQNKAVGPDFGNRERNWPIAFSGKSKSYKRKLIGLTKGSNGEAKIINDPMEQSIQIIAYGKGGNTAYDITLPALSPEDPSLTVPDTAVIINVNAMKFFLKNAVDEHTNFYINEDKVCCLTGEIGKTKGQNKSIGIVKLYYWVTHDSISCYLPENELNVTDGSIKDNGGVPTNNDAHVQEKEEAEETEEPEEMEDDDTGADYYDSD